MIEINFLEYFIISLAYFRDFILDLINNLFDHFKIIYVPHSSLNSFINFIQVRTKNCTLYF